MSVVSNSLLSSLLLSFPLEDKKRIFLLFASLLDREDFQSMTCVSSSLNKAVVSLFTFESQKSLSSLATLLKKDSLFEGNEASLPSIFSKTAEKVIMWVDEKLGEEIFHQFKIQCPERGLGFETEISWYMDLILQLQKAKSIARAWKRDDKLLPIATALSVKPYYLEKAIEVAKSVESDSIKGPLLSQLERQG